MELPSNPKPEKPLGHRAYGSIPHLPGSRRGLADKGLSEHQARILKEKGRDKHDTIIVQEKLEPSGHGAVDWVEGAVWRCERKTGCPDRLIERRGPLRACPPPRA